MNSISQFWSIRSKRERKLIAFVILMLALFIIINGFSNLLSSSGSAKRQYISAKTDYEYVKSGAKQLFYKSRAKDVQNNQQLLRKLLAELAQVNNITLTQINISEVKRPELDAALVGSNIAHQLKKKISYRRVVNKTIQSTMRMGAAGIRINVAGRLGGVEIARSEKFSDGSVPLHTLRADIDYALTVAHTQYGVIGIKVWICKGQFSR